jgi:hypothetical protein
MPAIVANPPGTGEADPRRAVAYQLPVNGTAGLAFSPDGRTLTAAGDQGKIYLWKIR